MPTDPVIPIFVSTIFFILLIGLVLRKLRQSHVIAYLLTGILLGPYVLGLIKDHGTLQYIGSFGVIFLLFFIGMEIPPKRITENWLISIVGTFLQVAVSIILIALLGIYFYWSVEKILLLGFVISLSSTAIVLKLIEDWEEVNTRVGQNVLGILLVQDILIVPMLILLNFLGGTKPSFELLAFQIVGMIAIFSLITFLTIRDQINLPWLKHLKKDNELQVFTSLGVCFGMAWLTDFMGLSAAIGAFLGGMIVGSARETHWIQPKLASIRTVFIALFFVSIGMLIDINFIVKNLWLLLFIVAIVLIVNTVVNFVILKSLGENWPESLYGGSLLSQCGEFSFVIATFGYQSKIITSSMYDVTILIIGMIIFFSPFWISFIRWIAKITEKKLERIP